MFIKKKSSKKLNIWTFFLHFIVILNHLVQKGKWQPKNEEDIEAWSLQLSNIHIYTQNLHMPFH
jgi:hypothetical protein